MSIKQFLQGKWLGHPVHSIVVSLPVGLWPAALCCDLLAAGGIAPDVPLRDLAFYATLLGLAGALLALPTGLADWWEIKRDKPAWKVGLVHMLLNIATTAVWAVNFWWRLGPARDAGPSRALVGLSAAGTLLLAVAVYLGGRLVYEHGISVARTSKEHWRRLALMGGARVPAEEKG